MSAKARDFNWHHVFGFWLAIPLFFVVASAVVISYPWASNLLFRMVGEEPPARSGPPGGSVRSDGRRSEGVSKGVTLAGLDSLWARAERQVPGWQSLSVRLSCKFLTC